MYCVNCGIRLIGDEIYCSNCGCKINNKSNKSENFNNNEDSGGEVPCFSSKVLLGGSILRPSTLILEKEELIYKKRNKNLIGVDKIVIPYKKISFVELDRKLITTTINIYTFGDKQISLEKFSISDAKKIKEIIAKRI